jgi:twitching motility two-component system response regulator PilG
LRYLGHKISTIVSETRAQLRILFETDAENYSSQNPEYQAIFWLVEHQYLTPAQAAELVEGLVKEVIESFLLVKEGTYELGKKIEPLPELCWLDLQPIVEYCQKRLQLWQTLEPEVWSPYQRPYFFNRNKTEQEISPEIQQKLTAMLKGFSFRHLAILLNQDELELAQSLHPYVVAGTILLDEPHPPFDQLPRIFKQLPENPAPPESVDTPALTSPIVTNNVATSFGRVTSTALLPEIPPRPPRPVQAVAPINNTPTDKTATPLGTTPTSVNSKSTYKIVCVDDSPTILKEISYFLEDESFSVFTISDPVKALMQIVRLKPDLILLDVRMAGINGYELCRLLRNHSLFKYTPIIMVTGNTGLIDRVKARLVGASGYLTKPFTQSELLKIVFRHLF